MDFVSPSLFYLLFALSIPIIIHLFNFRRYKRIDFTNVALLKDIEVSTKSAKKIKNLLILLMRLLALFFLVLAFTQPFIPAKNYASDSKVDAVAIFLDNSFSMGEMSGDQSLLEISKNASEEIVNTSQDVEQFYLLTNDFASSNYIALSREECLEAIEGVETSSQSKKWTEIHDRLSGISSEEALSALRVYMISDFQKDQFQLSNGELDSSLYFRLVHIKTERSSNFSIDSVFFNAPLHFIETIDTLNVVTTNFSEDELTEQPIRLFVDGQQRALVNVNLQAGEQKLIKIPIEMNAFGLFSAEVRSAEDGINHDNSLFFSYSLDSSIEVYHLGDEEVNRYLQAVFDNPFKYDNDLPGNADIGKISRTQTYFIDAGKDISQGLLSEMAQRVEKGAILAIYGKDLIDQGSLNEMLQALNLESISGADTSRIAVAQLNTESNLLGSSIERLPDNPSLPLFYGHFILQERQDVIKEDVMILENGRPALRGYARGKGRIYVFLGGLSENAGNISKQAIFVPICLNMAFNSAKSGELYHTIGKHELIEIKALSSEERIYHVRSKNIDVIPEIRNLGNTIYLQLHDQIREAGNYDLNDGQKNVNVISLNYDRLESDLDRYDEQGLEEFLSQFNGQQMELISEEASSISKSLGSTNRPRMLWKYCIILALAFFTLELLIIKFLK